jgi:hypothetical protein
MPYTFDKHKTVRYRTVLDGDESSANRGLQLQSCEKVDVE